MCRDGRQNHKILTNSSSFMSVSLPYPSTDKQLFLGRLDSYWFAHSPGLPLPKSRVTFPDRLNSFPEDYANGFLRNVGTYLTKSTSHRKALVFIFTAAI